MGANETESTDRESIAPSDKYTRRYVHIICIIKISQRKKISLLSKFFGVESYSKE